MEIKNKVNLLFSSLFSNINCEEPYIEYNILYIPFKYDFSNGLMVFDESRTLDPFRCKPFQFENASVDWIKMKYLTKEPAIYEMEQFLKSHV